MPKIIDGLPETLKLMRVIAGKKQVELAKILGRAQATIFQMESSRQGTSLFLLFKLMLVGTAYSHLPFWNALLRLPNSRKAPL